MIVVFEFVTVRFC